jgi:hypothetical protein
MKASPSLGRVLRVSFPCVTGTMRCSDFRTPLSPRFVPFAWRYHPLASVFVSPLRPDAGRGPGALGLAAPRQWLRTGDDRISQVPGEPCCAYALFSDPGRTAVTRPLQCSGMAPAMATAKAPTIRHFRGSIARLEHSLSTLRRASHLAATQDSFSGAGQALPDGIGYPQGSDERFPSCFLHLFLLSQAFLTQCHFATVSGGPWAGPFGPRKHAPPSVT